MNFDKLQILNLIFKKVVNYQSNIFDFSLE